MSNGLSVKYAPSGIPGAGVFATPTPEPSRFSPPWGLSLEEKKRREVLEAAEKQKARVAAAGARGATMGITGQTAPDFTHEVLGSGIPSNVEEGPISAVREGGRTIFTNQPGNYSDQLDYQTQVAAIRDAGAGTTIVSPYERDPYGRATSSATTRAEPGGFVRGGGEPLPGGGTDWSKVANPMGFESFVETPIGQILSERAAAQARAEALAKDPFAEQRLEGTQKIEAAKAPYEVQRSAELEDQKYLIGLEASLREELKQDPMWMARYRQDPIEGEKDFERRLQIKKDDFLRSRGKFAMRGESFS